MLDLTEANEMDNDIAQAFASAFLKVIPQLGITDAEFRGISECGKKIITPGVMAIVGIVGDLHGNVIYAMGEDNAKKIAGVMMGMPDMIEAFDEMAQSAVSELSNMLAANTCIELSAKGITADISTPTLMYGDFSANASFDRVIRIDMIANALPVTIYVSLEYK
jgi:chemotaxis protein CheX